MTFGKLHLHNFSLNAGEAFFLMLRFKKQAASTSEKDIIKPSVVYEKYPDEEVICCCLDCNKEIFSVTNTCEEWCDDYFDDLKKSSNSIFQF